ncbi:ABC transporter substrate-binding protein [Tistrella mobilis]|uniref:ABC transporter substrate-binding protein n=1 Tax=Tistrella mobilis TaxID=171437 RepID=UPI00355857EC
MLSTRSGARPSRRSLLKTIGLCGAALAALASGLPGGAVAAERTKVTVAALAFVSSSPLFIAKDRGYYEAEGLDVDIQIFRAAQPVAVAIASGDADFGVTAFTAGFYNLAGKGALKVIAGQSAEIAGQDGSAILVSNKAWDEGFRSVDDFPGHSLAMTQTGSSFHYMIGRIAEARGFDLSKVDLKPLQAVPNMIAALKSGQVDAMIIVPHIAKGLVDSGAAKMIGRVADIAPYQLGGLFTSTRNVTEHRDMVERFVRAYVKAAADYNATLNQNDAKGERVYGPDTQPVVDIINKYVYPEKPNDAGVKAGAMYIEPAGRFDAADIADQLRWYKQHDLVDADVEAASFVDTSFVPGGFSVQAK